MVRCYPDYRAGMRVPHRGYPSQVTPTNGERCPTVARTYGQPDQRVAPTTG
jgi:hypothetical protein